MQESKLALLLQGLGDDFVATDRKFDWSPTLFEVSTGEASNSSQTSHLRHDVCPYKSFVFSCGLNIVSIFDKVLKWTLSDCILNFICFSSLCRSGFFTEKTCKLSFVGNFDLLLGFSNLLFGHLSLQLNPILNGPHKTTWIYQMVIFSCTSELLLNVSSDRF